ncbi:hypothetical protein ACVDFE_00050 [Lentzea chajnantorensis]
MNGGRQVAQRDAFGGTIATPFAEHVGDLPRCRGGAGQENGDVFRGSAESSRSGRTGATADASLTPALVPAAELQVLFARLKAGGMRGDRVVGERDRSVHVIPMPDLTAPPPPAITALCSESFGPGELDLVDNMRGVGFLPCDQCFAELLLRTKNPQ